MDFKKESLDFHSYDFCGNDTQSILNSLKRMNQHWIKLEDPPNVFTCHSNVPDIYKCENCDFETNLKTSLTHHWNVDHKNLKKHPNHFRNMLRQCGNCDFQTYSMLVLLKHFFDCDHSETEMDNEIFNWLECGQCPYKTKDKSYLRRHITRMHSPNVALFHCKECSFKTKAKRNLQQHTLSKHTNLKNIDSSHEAELKAFLNRRVKLTDSENVAWYHCDKCDYKTMWRADLRQHMANIHTDPADIVWQHCDKCEFKTKTKYSMKQHVRYMHTDDILWYHCDNCDFKTKSKHYLKLHIAKIHAKDSPDGVWYRCDHCEYKTRWKANFGKHLLNHADSASTVWHHCDHCDYKAKRKDTLKQHTVGNHTDPANVVWFRCDKCEYKTKWKYHLKQHAKVHINSANVVWYRCDKCEYKTKSKEALKRHTAKIHTASECSVV